MHYFDQNISSHLQILESLMHQFNMSGETLPELRCTINDGSHVNMSAKEKEKCVEFLRRLFHAQSLTFKISMGICYLILFIIGVLGNLLVIVCIVSFRSMHSRTNIFLLNLAISDLLVFFTCVPINTAYLIWNEWIWGEKVCHIYALIQGICVCISIFSLSSISINRFLVIHRPLQAKQRITRRVMMIWMLLIWLASVTLCLPLTFAAKIKKSKIFGYYEHHSCEEVWANAVVRRVYNVSSCFLIYIIPVVSMATFYGKMSRELQQSVQSIGGVQQNFSRVNGGGGLRQSNRCNRNSSRQRVSKTLIALLCVFAVCWFPHHLVNIWSEFGSPATDQATFQAASQYVYPVIHLLGYAHSALDPLCLLFLSSNYKQCCRQIFRLQCLRQRRVMSHNHLQRSQSGIRSQRGTCQVDCTKTETSTKWKSQSRKLRTSESNEQIQLQTLMNEQ